MNFFKICVLSQCLGYYINFQNIYSLKYHKTFLQTLFYLFLKLSKASSVSLIVVRVIVPERLMLIAKRKWSWLQEKDFNWLFVKLPLIGKCQWFWILHLFWQSFGLWKYVEERSSQACKKVSRSSIKQEKLCSITSLLYGVAENVHTNTLCPALKENKSRPIVYPIVNYILKYLYFAMESLLPLLFFPKSIVFSYFVSRDSKTLSQLEMNYAAATYQLKDTVLVFVR